MPPHAFLHLRVWRLGWIWDIFILAPNSPSSRRAAGPPSPPCRLCPWTLQRTRLHRPVYGQRSDKGRGRPGGEASCSGMPQSRELGCVLGKPSCRTCLCVSSGAFSGSVLVCWGRRNKGPQTSWFKTIEMCVRRPEIRKQGVSWLCSPRGLQGRTLPVSWLPVAPGVPRPVAASLQPLPPPSLCLSPL